MMKDNMREEVKKNMSRWLGKDNASYKHGMTWTHIYQVWQNMKRRINDVNNKRYKNYWWRWISYDKKWEEFEGFYNDMYPSYKKWLTLDRIDNDWNYCKENCKWSSLKQQANNRSSNIIIDIDWRTQTLMQWCEELNLPYDKIIQRIKILKWDEKKALELI